MSETGWFLGSRSGSCHAEVGRRFEASVRRSLIDELRRIVESEAGKVYFVELQCGTEALLQRLDNPGRQAFGKLTDVDLYRSIEAQGGFDFPPMPDPWLIIDTETCSPQDAARRIAAKLKDRSS